jgi:hypothetical protein
VLIKKKKTLVSHPPLVESSPQATASLPLWWNPWRKLRRAFRLLRNPWRKLRRAFPFGGTLGASYAKPSAYYGSFGASCGESSTTLPSLLRPYAKPSLSIHNRCVYIYHNCHKGWQDKDKVTNKKNNLYSIISLHLPQEQQQQKRKIKITIAFSYEQHCR